MILLVAIALAGIHLQGHHIAGPVVLTVGVCAFIRALLIVPKENP